jgi:hypothetical protein
LREIARSQSIVDMHTAQQLSKDMFTIELHGKPARREDILHWGAEDRLGIVVNTPYGGLGAGLLVSLAITAFYDVEGKQRRSRYLYPDNYLFHVGGPWGSHGYFDFWPEYRELFIPNNKRAVLAAINSHGVTHLAVPIGRGDTTRHRFGEDHVAYDRIKEAILYSPDGCVPDANIVIRANHPNVYYNYEFTLSPEKALEDTIAYAATLDPTGAEANDMRFALELTRSRVNEVAESDPTRHNSLWRLSEAVAGAGLREELRKISVEHAINLLV